jgi:hypothetical protein
MMVRWTEEYHELHPAVSFDLSAQPVDQRRVFFVEFGLGMSGLRLDLFGQVKLAVELLNHRLEAFVGAFRVPGVDGDGLQMAWEVGAAPTEMTMELIYMMPGRIDPALERYITSYKHKIDMRGPVFTTIKSQIVG